MCGIAATFAYGPDADPVDRDELIAIRDRMRNRGPDGEGVWISDDRRIGLAHRRLSIIDLSEAGAQPMWNAERTLCITYNGEIYNYAALRAQLVDRGYRFDSHCDTEVLLQLYADKGADMLNDLRGMYAFVIWDARNRTIFAGRDPFGIKPLYYSADRGTIRLASQLKALLESKHIDRTPEPAGHVAFFIWGTVPDPWTMYEKVRALPVGHSLALREGGEPEIKLFSSIPEILREAELASSDGNISPADQRETLHAALRESADHHLVADVPVGVFLSAGLDSSTIAALVSEAHSDVRTVTLGFDEYRGTSGDETQLAEVVARQYRTNHQTIWITRHDFEADVGNLFEAMDRPSIDGVNTYFVSLAAKRAGLKVALSGLGGDEIFAGYSSFTDVPRIVRMARRWRGFARFGGAFRIVTQGMLRRFTSPKYGGLFEYGSDYPGAYLLRRSLFMPWELPELLDPDLVREGWRRLSTLGELGAISDSLQSPRLKVSSLELCWYMRHQLLRDSDWAGMAHSLEIRVPFVDVQMLRQIAPLLAGSNPPSKRDMAATPNAALPDAVLTRPKTGFVVPVREWLLQSLDPTMALDRGLRGWSKYVYDTFTDHRFLRSPKGRPRAPLGPRRGPAFRKTNSTSRHNILVYRIGQLGDTIVALPAMWAIRENFPAAKITLLCDQHPISDYVLASDLLKTSGIFDEFLAYPAAGGLTGSPRSALKLMSDLRSRDFDTLVYLAPTGRNPARVRRDYLFFRSVGIRSLIGMTGFPAYHKPQQRTHPLTVSPRESELLMLRLRDSGLRVDLQRPRFDLNLGDSDRAEVQRWLATLEAPTSDKPLVAVGPGSKMPAKQWPVERYERVVKDLIRSEDVWPIVFGGTEDQPLGEALIRSWGRGFNAAGALSVRGAVVAISQCAFYLGNDTGTMHMAAVAGIPCVALFSSRERPGMWYPAGARHRIFRTNIECEGCGLVECVIRQNECLKRISTDEVLEACLSLHRAVPSNPEPASFAV